MTKFKSGDYTLDNTGDIRYIVGVQGKWYDFKWITVAHKWMGGNLTHQQSVDYIDRHDTLLSLEKRAELL